MLVTIVKFLSGLVSQELLKAALKQILLEGALELLADFVKRTDNVYDDKLVEKFREFLDEHDGDNKFG